MKSIAKVGDIDKAFLKQAIETSLTNSDPKAKSKRHMKSSLKELDLDTIGAYEIAFHVNFQPALVDDFLSIVSGAIAKNINSIHALRQTVRIINKTALSCTSLQMIERFWSSKELMDSIQFIFTTYFKEKKSLWNSLTSLIVTDMEKDMLLHRAAEMV